MLDNVMIGKRIKECRIAADVSQELLAEWTGLSSPHISRIENGKKNVSAKSLAEIAAALRISADYLMFGEQPSGTQSDSPLRSLVSTMSPEEELVAYETLKALLASLRASFKSKNRRAPIKRPDVTICLPYQELLLHF